MMLQTILPGSSTVNVVQFTGQNWDLTLAAALPANNTTTATSGSQLQTDLNNATIGTIDLPAGQTIYSSEPIEITRSVIINGQGATLEFQQNGAIWPSSTSGAIYVVPSSPANLQITLENFTIKFADTPLQWYTPSGSLYDPENDSANGMVLAVFNDETNNQNYNTDVINFSGMTINSPPAWDAGTNGSNFFALQNELSNTYHDSLHAYVGEQAIPLILTNPADTGRITNSQFQGGPVTLTGGPWVITNNTMLGASQYTYSSSAFGINSATNSGARQLLIISGVTLGR